ncbi:MAG: hypothetical protein QNJ16_07085 [Rhodobacter sp.]|nr:hypothetical protein [Rhodobacter sp.]
MIQAEPIGLWNTGLPLVVLGALAVALPWLLVRRATRSHREVAVTIWSSAGLLLIAGAAVFAVLYAVRGAGVAAALAEAPLATAWFFLRLSGFAAVVWAPLLGLVWLGLAQGVERRRGEDVARGKSS